MTKAGARFCRRCGQHLAQPAEPPAAVPPSLPTRPVSLDDKLAHLQRYLPPHITDKILANRGRLAGERKLVTVLFADIVGYTTLSEQLGEEALFALMDKLYERLIHEIHRYEGTVNELTGDGLVAFFGRQWPWSRRHNAPYGRLWPCKMPYSTSAPSWSMSVARGCNYAWGSIPGQ